MSVLNQKTLKNPITINGVGLHTGKMVNMKIFPAEPNSGIIFKRRSGMAFSPEVFGVHWDSYERFGIFSFLL